MTKLEVIHGNEYLIPFESFRKDKLDKFKKPPNEAVIHCSASDSSSYGALAIHADHLKRDNETWAGCGYHFVIEDDGKLVHARPAEFMGSHCSEQRKNHTTIGICVCGNTWFDQRQAKSLLKILSRLGFIVKSGFTYPKYKLLKRVSPHNRYSDLKTCPNFILDYLFEDGRIRSYIGYKDGVK